MIPRMTDPVHALGYRIGDRVPVFWPGGVTEGTAERFTPSGRLVVEVRPSPGSPDRIPLQFNARGLLIGNPGRWYHSKTIILPAGQAEAALKFKREEIVAHNLGVQLRNELRRLEGFAVRTPEQRAFVAESLRELAKKIEGATP